MIATIIRFVSVILQDLPLHEAVTPLVLVLSNYSWRNAIMSPPFQGLEKLHRRSEKTSAMFFSIRVFLTG
ncbi:unnamed protein product [Rhodiola kirilowii]